MCVWVYVLSVTLSSDLCWVRFSELLASHSLLDRNRSLFDIRLSLVHPTFRGHTVDPRWTRRPSPPARSGRPAGCHLCSASNSPHHPANSIRWSRSRTEFSWIYPVPSRCAECRRIARTARGSAPPWCRTRGCPRTALWWASGVCLVRCAIPAFC